MRSELPWYENSDKVKSVEMSDSLTSIGYRAFDDCKSLNSVTIKNPNCGIFDEASTICHNYENKEYIFSGTIHGYAGSTAEAYAPKYGRKFEALPAEAALETGDLDGDGEISVTDAQYILNYYVQNTVLGANVPWSEIIGA